MLSGAATSVLGYVAGGLGLAGLAVAVLASRRRTVTWLVMLALFALLATGGGLLARGGDSLRAPALAMLAFALCGCVAASAAMIWRDGHLAVVAEGARTAADATKREVVALEAARSGLEEQLVSSRRRVKELIERAEEDEPVAPERVQRYRERIRALRADAEKLRQVIDNVHDGIVLLEDETLRLVRFTPSMARITGLPPEELGRCSLLDLLERGPAEPGRADLQRIAHERRPLQAKIVRADETRLPVELSVMPVGTGEDVQLMVVLRDVSEQAALRRELDAARDTIADAGRRLDGALSERSAADCRGRALERELAALRASREDAVEAVAHDLRVPLTSVRSFSEILLRNEDTDPAVQREFLDIIRRESERLTDLIDELLDARRVGAGVEAAPHEDVDLRDVVGGTVTVLRGLAKERGVAFEGAWEGEPHVVRGDAAALRRMVEKLLANALQFGSEGGAVEILLREGSETGSVLLGIRDHGPGIRDDELDIVFERFHRASVGEDRVPGAGLGLSICREIAAAHGARIWPETDGAGGATLWVQFPPPGGAPSQTSGTAAAPRAAEAAASADSA